jgi:hypothetical protein
MRQIELLMRLQRLLDEETTATGPDEGADLIEQMNDVEDLDDFGPGGDELQEVFGMNKDKDDLDSELEELLGGGNLEGVEAELGLTGLKAGNPPPTPEPHPSGDRDRGSERPLQRLLRDAAEKRRARGAAGPAGRRGGKGGGERPVGRLLDLLQAIGDLRDRQSETSELRRLRKFMFQREAPGGLGAPEPRDPVVARRRKQVQEFFAAWREALDKAPPEAGRVAKEGATRPADGTAPAPSAAGPAGTPGSVKKA